MEHAGHLAVLGALKLADVMLLELGKPWKYYSSLAILCNCLRDTAKDFLTAWCSIYKAESALRHARKLFPRCCAGRWLSVDEAEKRFLSCGAARVQQVVNQILPRKSAQKTVAAVDGSDNEQDGDEPAAAQAPKAKAKPKPKAKSKTPSSDIGAVDTLAVEQSAHYSETMGKWRRHAVRVVNDPLFGCMVFIMNGVKEPLTHLSAFLKKTVPEKELCSRGNTLHQLVTYKAQMIAGEFDELMGVSEIFSNCTGTNAHESSSTNRTCACLGCALQVILRVFAFLTSPTSPSSHHSKLAMLP